MLRSYLTRKGYECTLEDTNNASIISEALAIIRVGIDDA